MNFDISLKNLKTSEILDIENPKEVKSKCQ